jgi:phosphoglycerate kinase
LSVRNMVVAERRVFLRVDLNVPMKGGAIADDTRILSALPTLKYLMEKGAAVVACSHMGRPKGKVVSDLSLAPVAARLQELLPGRKVLFASDVVGPDAMARAAALGPGDLLLLENIRFEPGETGGDPALASRLRKLADLYVSDAFGAVHRAHASVSVLPPLFPQAGAGFLVQKELDYLEGRLGDPVKPYSAFLGGAKVSDKIPVLRNMVQKVDNLCIGGAMAYTFLLAEGKSTGKSLVENDLVPACREILLAARKKGVAVFLPTDHRVAASMDSGEESTRTADLDHVPHDLSAFDIGPVTARTFADVAGRSGTIFWNGPMGVFERRPFAGGTLELARAIAESGAVSVIGGGDSVSAVHAAGVADRISHISTGGGASLALLAGDPLPGLDVLTRA